MGKAYRSQIQFYAQPVEDAIQALEAKLVAGVEDISLQTLIDDLGRKIERYNNSTKPVKAAYDPRQDFVHCFICWFWVGPRVCKCAI